jgi:hypothetical protein
MAEGKPGLDWAREMMERADVSPKDVARSWNVSEASVIRWLDGLVTTDIAAVRVARFSRLVKRPVGEIMTHLGYEHG